MTAKKSRLSYAVLIVMASTLFSRIIGFIREMMLPNMLTMGVETDAYNNAFILPDLMYSLLLGGAISAALIPVLSGYIDTDKEKEGWRVVSTFVNTVFLLMLMLCAAGVIFSGGIMKLLISGQDKETTRYLATRISRVLFPSIAFLMLSGILNGVLNSHRKFAAAALGPVIYNAGSVLSIYFLSPYGVDRIAYGILGSAVLYFLTVLAFSYRKMKFYIPKVSYRDRETRKLFALAFPSFLSASVIQLNIMVSMKFTNYFEEGKVTAFKLADRTWQMPYGIIAVSMGIALLPTLSGVYAKRDMKHFSDLIIKSIKYILTLILPCSAAFIILNARIINTLFRFSANLSGNDITVISRILLIFSAALITQSVIAILNRAFYSMQNTKIPLFTGLFSIAVNILISYFFYKYTKLNVNGIAVAYSISSLINLVLLSLILRTKVKEAVLSDITAYLTRIILPLAGMSLTMLLLNKLMPLRSNGVTMISKLSEALSLAGLFAAGLLVYIVLMLVLRVREGTDIYNRICRKLKLKQLVINDNS